MLLAVSMPGQGPGMKEEHAQYSTVLAPLRAPITLNLGYCPPAVTIYIRGPIIRATYNQTLTIIQLLLSGGSTQPKP